jgi:hypothetical protein
VIDDESEIANDDIIFDVEPQKIPRRSLFQPTIFESNESIYDSSQSKKIDSEAESNAKNGYDVKIRC